MRNPAKRRTNALHLLLLGAGMLIAVSCGDDQGPSQTNGTILIGALTSGQDLDGNGYLVSVDGGQGTAIGLLDTVFVTSLDPTTHVVTLSGIAENCTPEGNNPRSAAVIPGDTVSVVFEINCELIDGGGGGQLRTR